MACASVVILLLTTVAPASVLNITVLVWLGTVALLLLLNPGAAVGVFILAVAVYAAAPDGGMALRRPDNLATPLVVMGLSLLAYRRARGSLFDITVVTVIAFCVYGLFQVWRVGFATDWRLVFWFRMFGVPLAVFALLLKSCFDRREVDGLLFTLIVAGVYFAWVSIFEKLGSYEVILPPWLGDPSVNEAVGSGRAGGVFVWWAFNGLAMTLTLAILLNPGARYARKRIPLVAGAALIMVLGIFVTYTRGAWLAALIGVPLLLMARPSATFHGLHRGVLVGVGLCALLAVAVTFPTGRSSQRAGDVGTVVYRLNLWLAGWQMVKERPLLGRGFGEFRSAVADYQVETDLIPFRELYAGAVAHNTPVQVAAEQGLAGLFLYSLILVEALRRARRGALALWGKAGGWFVIGFMGMYLVQVQFITANEMATALLFFGTLGAIAGVSIQRPPAERAVTR